MHFTKIAEGCFFFLEGIRFHSFLPDVWLAVKESANVKIHVTRQTFSKNRCIWAKPTKTFEMQRNTPKHWLAATTRLQRRDKQMEKKGSGETHMLFHDILNASYLQQQTKKRCACFFFQNYNSRKKFYWDETRISKVPKAIKLLNEYHLRFVGESVGFCRRPKHDTAKKQQINQIWF